MSTRATGGQRKRAMDLAIGIPALVAALPVMAVLAAWVRIDSRGPALFRHQRVGLHGRPFRVNKFRTMVVDAESMGSGLRVTAGDDRITRAGRFLRRTSLDELPQLFNVLGGSMSIVGPRPTVAAQVERYDARQRGRLDAKPGITGLAQVRGRNSLPWSQRIEMDLEYVRNWSLRLDLAIMLRTFGVVMGRDDTYAAEGGAFDLPEREE